MDHYIAQLVDLTNPAENDLASLSMEEARHILLQGDPTAVRSIEGSFALVARDGKTVRMARSLDRPMRYFLAKRTEGPALIVADRIDAIDQWMTREGLSGQFHPSYTRMIPAHHVVEIQLVGCPDPDPVYTRFFTPQRNALSTDLDEIGRAYIGALADEISRWLGRIPSHEPIGVCFSGGIDSGAVFLATYHILRELGLPLGRLKAFTLSLGGGADVEQARAFLQATGLELFLEPIESAHSAVDLEEAIRVVEDYKALDIECAAMGLALCRGIRDRYPDWRWLVDGDGGDENLKDYPIHENPELTIRSVINNLMLYHEGWGVGRIKHSLTYSGGLSRSYTRTYAPLSRLGFKGFSPFMRPSVIEVAEGIPFEALTNRDVEKLYALKGEIVSRGIRAITGIEMPVFSKRRFQHGAVSDELADREFSPRYVSAREANYRRHFLSLYPGR
jgi:asparagine synthase (glutamine-hydrolysing)